MSKVIELIRNGSSTDVIQSNLTGINLDHETNSDGDTPLMVAVKTGRKDVVELLLQNNVNVDISKENGMTALMMAAISGNNEVLELLISKGADVNRKDHFDNTALIYAIKFGHLICVNTLINSKNIVLDIDHDSSQTTELMVAAALGNERIVEALLNKGADINKKNVQKMDPLMFAVNKNNKTIVELLIQKGALVNEADSHGWSPIMVAARKGYGDIANILLQKNDNNALLNKTLPNGFNAMLIAARNGQTAIVKLFLDKGDSLDHLQFEDIKKIFREGSNINKDTLHILLKGTNKPDIKDLLYNEYIKRLSAEEKKSELTTSLEDADEKQIALLIELGALTDVTPETFQTLSPAIKNYYLVKEALKVNPDLSLMEDYIRKGANINSRMYSCGMTLLHNMIVTNKTNLLEFLLNHGGNVDVPNEEGNTCLHLAVGKGESKVIEKLLEYDPMLNVLNNESKKPTEMTQNRDIIDILQNYEPKIITERNKAITACYDIFNEDKSYDERMRIFSAIKNEPSIRNNIDREEWLNDNNIRSAAGKYFSLTEYDQNTDFYVTSSHEEIDRINLLERKISEFKNRQHNLQQKLCLGVCLGKHWASLTILKDSQNSDNAFVMYHDPYGAQIPDNIIEIILKSYNKVTVSSNSQRMQPPGDTYSCGLHTLVNIAYYSSLTDEQFKTLILQNPQVKLHEAPKPQMPLEESKDQDEDNILSPESQAYGNNNIRLNELLELLKNTSESERAAKLNEALEKYSFDFESTDSDGNTILHHSVSNDWTDIIGILIQKGANPNKKNTNGETPMHKAVYKLLAKGSADTTIIETLMDFNARISIVNNTGKTPFDYLIETNIDTAIDAVKTSVEGYIIDFSKTGDINEIAELLKIGIDPNYQDQGTNASPLYYAMKFGYSELCHLLVLNGGKLREPEVSSKSGNSFLDMIGSFIPSLFGLNYASMDSEQQENHVQDLVPYNKDSYELARQNTVIDLAAHGNFASAKEFAGEDIDIADQNGSTLLHIAVRKKDITEEDIKEINDLINSGIKCETVDKDERNALHYAVESQNIEVIEAILFSEKIGICTLYDMLETKDINGMRPLDYAVQNGNLELAKIIMEKQIYLHAKKGNPITGYNPLMIHYAVANSHVSVKNIESLVSTCASLLMIYDNPERVSDKDKLVEIRRKLLERDLKAHDSKNIVDIDEIEDLIDKYFKDDTRMADKKKELMKKIVNYQDRDFRLSPMHFAVKREDIEEKTIELINYLIESKANINCEDVNRMTPLHHAVWENNTAVVRALITQRGLADVNVDDLSNGRTPIHYAVLNKNEKILKLLLKNKAELNKPDDDGCLPLHYAVTNMCEISMIEKLITRTSHEGIETININMKDNSGKTPLDYAVIMGRTDIVARFFVETGVLEHINFGKKKTNILNLASAKGHLDIIGIIEPGRGDGGVILNTQDELGRTPLHLASMNGHLKVVNHLLQANVQKDAEDTDKRTALHLAIIHEKIDVMESLINAGCSAEKKDSYDMSAISYAFLGNNNELKQRLIRLLSKKSVNVNAKLVDELTSLGEEKNKEEFKAELINKMIDLLNQKSIFPIHNR